MQAEEVFALVAVLLIISGAIVLVLTTIQRGRLRELAYRERLAMIERGVAPPPEVDPARFERAMGEPGWDERALALSARYRRLGVTFMGLGAALAMIISFAAREPEVAIGIGGAVFILGVAMYSNSQLELRHASRARRSGGTHPEPAPRTENRLENRTENREP